MDPIYIYWIILVKHISFSESCRSISPTLDIDFCFSSITITITEITWLACSRMLLPKKPVKG